MVKASHSVRDSDSRVLDFILSEKKSPSDSSPSCPDKIVKEKVKKQNFVQRPRKVTKMLQLKCTLGLN